jgi:putative peptidoglycan lipid II flippase
MKKKLIALMGGGLIGKCAGVGRELLVASLYGTGSVASAYRLAQAGVFIPVNLFAAEVLNATTIPLQRKYRTNGGAQAEARFAQIALAGFGAIGSLLGWGMFFCADEIIRVLAPGFDLATHAQAASFLKILSFGVPLYVLASLMSYLELGMGGHTLTTLRATVQSVCLIASTFAAYALGRPGWLAAGFVVAQVVCCLWGSVLLRARGLLRFQPITLQHAREIGLQVGKLMRPLVLLPVLMQGNAAVERIVASKLAVGAVAGIDYARLISDTINILVTVPFALTVLCELSGRADKDARRMLLRLLTPLALITVPASAFLCAHATQVVAAMYGRGAFGKSSIDLTSPILALSAVALWAQAFGYVIQRALSARMQNAAVIRTMAVSLTISVLINLTVSRWLGVAAIGLAVAAYGVVNCVLGARALGYRFEDFSALVWLVAGEIVYVGIASQMDLLPGIGGLISAIAASGIFWTFWILIHGKLRRTLAIYLRAHMRRGAAL